MLKKLNSRKGFTLIELLIVVAISGIIAAIAVPTLVSTRGAALESKAKSNLRALSSAQAAYIAKNGTYGSWAELLADNYLDSRWTAGFTEDGVTYNESQNGSGLQQFEGEAVIPAPVSATWFIDETGELQKR